MARGYWAKKGQGRSPRSGFQPGHPPYYTGGAVRGHAPTSDASHLQREVHPVHDPASSLYPYRFDQKTGRENARKGGRWAKDRERQCLEALQNGSDPAKLAKRFPPGMVTRLAALHKVAEDASHRDFMHAQRMISDILKRLARSTAEEGEADGSGSMGVAAIELAPGSATPPPLFEKEEAPPAGVPPTGGA